MERGRIHRLTGALILGLLLQGNYPTEKKSFEFNGYAQGTSYHVRYFAETEKVDQGQLEITFSVLDSSLSVYKPWSLINRFNNSTEGVQTDLHLRTVVEKSLKVYEDSDGLFDITVYPLMEAWGFGNKAVLGAPDSASIKSLMKCVGSEKIYLQGNFLGKKDPCIRIDVNGIAQGYTVDIIAGLLERNGIENYLVEVGGELRVKGRKYPGSEEFRIGVADISEFELESTGLKKIIHLDHGAVTTSGVHGKQRKTGDKIITHLMNPKTGFPLKNDMISATVIATDAVTADGYDNVLMELGAREALVFMGRHQDLEAYLIYQMPDGRVRDTATVGFYKMVEK